MTNKCFTNKTNIMKKFLLFLTMLLSVGVTSFAGDGKIHLNYHPIGSTHGGSTKSPTTSWYIEQNGNVLNMSATETDFTLNLYDEDGDIVYTTFVPAGTTMVTLPSTLSGCFEICFETATYYYYGYIYL